MSESRCRRRCEPLFCGETLRGMLFSAWAFWMVGQIDRRAVRGFGTALAPAMAGGVAADELMERGLQAGVRRRRESVTQPRFHVAGQVQQHQLAAGYRV
jgi:hypothetical protein